jgi:hypothetical protein
MNGRALLAATAALVIWGVAAAPAAAQDHTPQPYSPDEFQSWMKEAWRAEAVFIGSFPFTLFFTLEGYDMMRYVTNRFTPSYAPWPFGSGAAVSYSAEETLWLALSAVSLSMVISGVDFLLGRVNGRFSRP